MGTIIGVGVFGIPFVFAKAGFLTGLFFLIGVWLLVTVLYLAYGEVVLRTSTHHQLVGYANKYIGNRGKNFALLATFFGMYGAMLAYLIIIGSFLVNVLGSWVFFTPFTFSILFFIFCSIAILLGLRAVAWFELSLTAFFLAILCLIFYFGFPKVSFQNFFPLFQKDFWFLPYGVILFAFGGLSAIPIQHEILDPKIRERIQTFKDGQRIKQTISDSEKSDGLVEEEISPVNKFRSAVRLGTFIPFIFYLLFAILIVGVSGDATTPETVSGIFEVLGSKAVFLLSLFGILAITTTFLLIGASMYEVFKFDFGLNRFYSWSLTIWIPFLLFLLGLNNFINVISVVGAVGGGIEGIIVMMVWKRVRSKSERKPEYSINLPKWGYYLIITLLSVGIGYALFS
ncbi:MAG: hypothetical protein HYW77_01255 [Parcubacteria group bacterium]|nr:hypothetical protein [Parcubacteria group bacterium]